MVHAPSIFEGLSGLIPSRVRNRFFRGKFLDAKDLTREQAYFLERHRLHGQMIGRGVVWGLRVVNDEGECSDRSVIVEPGLAIDRLGREVAVADNHPLELPRKQVGESGGRTMLAPGNYYVCIRYAEGGSDPVPCLDTDAYGDASRKEDNCTTEFPWIGIIGDDQLPIGQWREARGTQADPNESRPSEREAGYPIPLARLIVGEHSEHDEQAVHNETQGSQSGIVIDLLGRPVLALNAQALTHIVGTSWTHGGTHDIGSEQLRDGILDVRLDRSLDKDCIVDEMAFSVTAIAPNGTMRQILGDVEKPLVKEKEGHRHLVFKIPPRLLEPDDRESVLGHTIQISIACDFLLDENGRPIDGNHIGGRLPTGNGVTGGRFESWFRISQSAAVVSVKSAAKDVRGEKA